MPVWIKEKSFKANSSIALKPFRIGGKSIEEK